MEAFRTLRHLGHVSELTIELAAIAGERPEGGSFIGIQTVMGNLEASKNRTFCGMI